MASSSSLSLSLPSSSLSPNWAHDVFPSFHGPDVRTTFLSHMLKEFRNKGINTFIDNEINRGQPIGPELKRAIRGSKIAVVLLSDKYASSSWCLDELVEIMNKESDQTVITIFYRVNPTDVKKQMGDFGKVFKETCQGKTEEKIETWRKGLEDVATIAGYHSINWDDEAAMIEEIATHISTKLNIATPSRDLDRFIGMGAHMERLESLLRLDSNDVRMIGIWGPPGIGKSTIARILFNRFSSSFQLSAIMVNIKGSYPRPCLDEGSAQLQLQNHMLSQMLNHNTVITHLGVAQERLKGKKVFLVLDDVDRLAQLVALAEKNQWFGLGSRVVITTEDQRVLKAHGINDIYKVDFPTTDEALQMFCMYAFDQKYPKDGFTELAREVTHLVGELPLGLQVMGSHFRGMSKDDWTETLPRLRKRLDRNIESVLRFSYDALDDEDKDLFLHIACFFLGREIEKVVEYLEKRFPDVRQRLVVLYDKSLLIRDSLMVMHYLLAQLGRDINHKQRLFLDDIHEEFIDDAAGRRSVIGIDIFNNKLNIDERAFEGMANLQFLRVDGRLPHGLSYLPPKLRLLVWQGFPMKCLPSSVNVEFLVELNMYCSKLEKLWEGNKSLRNLKRMDLFGAENLKELPNLSTAISLEELQLHKCSSLVKLPSSIGKATNLQKLKLSCCSSLVKLPFSIGNATNLQELDLRNCTSLMKLPSSIGNATKLQKLDLCYCSSLMELPSIEKATNLQNLNLCNCSSLVKLPSSIWNATTLNLSYCSNLVELPSIEEATNLQYLNLCNCSSLVKLPSSIGNATNLWKLDLSCCSSLVELPSSIGNATNLQELDLSYCSTLVELPSSIGNAINLRKLDLSYCSTLVELPSSVGNAINLQELDLSYCSTLVELPSSVGNAINLQELSLRNCSSLVKLPSSIGNLKSLEDLDFSGCSSLKVFPEISTNVSYIDLSGTAIEKVPSSIITLHRLEELTLKECKKILSLPQLPESLSTLNAVNCESLERLDCSFRNLGIHLNFDNCFKLNKEARDLIIHTSRETTFLLEKFGYSHPYLCTWVLPGNEIPICFNHRANGGSLTLNFYGRHFPSTVKFKACILMDRKNEIKDSNKKNANEDSDEENGVEDCEENYDTEDGDEDNEDEDSDEDNEAEDSDEETDIEDCDDEKEVKDSDKENDTRDGDEENKVEGIYDDVGVCLEIMDKHNSHTVLGIRDFNMPCGFLTEHLYIFEFEADVTSHELFCEFSIKSRKLVIKECGVNYGDCEAEEK